ncbi:MAG: DUF4236 domain-containing protein [Planctomycetota bacterium]
MGGRAILVLHTAKRRRKGQSIGFPFFRRMKFAVGVSPNFSKTSISPWFGVRDARVTLGRRGARKTVGIPGTGLFYTGRRGRESVRGRAHLEGVPEQPMPSWSMPNSIQAEDRKPTCA